MCLPRLQLPASGSLSCETSPQGRGRGLRDVLLDKLDTRQTPEHWLLLFSISKFRNDFRALMREAFCIEDGKNFTFPHAEGVALSQQMLPVFTDHVS